MTHPRCRLHLLRKVRRTLVFGSLLLLLSPALIACKSASNDAYGDRIDRDYYSNNKKSVSFLMESLGRNKDERRQTNRQMWDWAEIRANNKQIRKESVAFLGRSLWIHEWDNFKLAWGTGLPRELSGNESRTFGESVRFGFLDTGD